MARNSHGWWRPGIADPHYPACIFRARVVPGGRASGVRSATAHGCRGAQGPVSVPLFSASTEGWTGMVPTASSEFRAQ